MEGLRFVPLGYQQYTSTSPAFSLSSIPAGATSVLISSEAQSIRWRDDGTAPTASVGQLQIVASPPFLYSGNLSALQFIQATAGAILNVNYYRTAG